MWVCRPSLFLCLCLWHQVTAWDTCQVKLTSACGILAYTVHCSRKLVPDFVCFCFFLIGWHRNISTALVHAFEPTHFTSFFIFYLTVAIYSLNPLFPVPLQGKHPLAVFAQSGRWGKGGLKTASRACEVHTAHRGELLFNTEIYPNYFTVFVRHF